MFILVANEVYYKQFYCLSWMTFKITQYTFYPFQKLF